MKALIRDDEIILEPFPEWVQDHLTWLVTPRPNGDGYILLDGYEPEEHGKLSKEELLKLFCNSA